MATIKKFDIENATEADLSEWLQKFSDTELQMLTKALTVETRDRGQRRIDAARAEIEASLERQGLALADVFGNKRGPASGSKVAPKYRNPADPTQTWTGRGKRPTWLADMLSGKSDREIANILAEMEI